MSKLSVFFLQLLLAAFFWMPVGEAWAGNTCKDAHRAVRELKKQGWRTLSGKDDDLETQIVNLFICQSDSDTSCPRYIVETRAAEGKDYSSARKQALSSAKSGIASSIESNIVSICKQITGNRVHEDGKLESVNSMIAFARKNARQSISSTPVLVEIYRNLPNGNVEVRLSICFDTDTVRKNVSNAVAADEIQDSSNDTI